MSDDETTDSDGSAPKSSAPSSARSGSASDDRAGSFFTALVTRHGLVTIVGWVFLAGAVAVAVIGYIAVSGTADVSQQVNRLAGISVGALALLGIGSALLLSHHYRAAVDAVAELQQAVLDDLADRK